MIFRIVTHFDYVGACRYTGYINKSIKLKLECGHEQRRKASGGVPRKARCKDCERRACKVPRMVPSSHP